MKLQDFIDIIAVALKLFYMKSINYDYFEYEKDEFINLICYIYLSINLWRIVFLNFLNYQTKKNKKN